MSYKEFLAELLTNLSFWIIQKANQSKSRCLASRLLELSKDYDPRY
jgi:hypothetical protein